MTLRLAALTLGLAILTHGGGAGASGPIYKCAGANAVPLYTDLPCKGGAVLDIRPGDADPGAIDRLARLQARYDALAVAAAARSYADEQAHAPGSHGDFGGYDDQTGAETGDGVAYSPIYVSYRPFFGRGRGHRDRHKLHEGHEGHERHGGIEPHRSDFSRAMTSGLQSRSPGMTRGPMPQGG